MPIFVVFFGFQRKKKEKGLDKIHLFFFDFGFLGEDGGWKA